MNTFFSCLQNDFARIALFGLFLLFSASVIAPLLLTPLPDAGSQASHMTSAEASPFVFASSKPAKDRERDEQNLGIGMRIVLSLLAFAGFPFLLLAITALVVSMANPMFWLWLLLMGLWAVGFGFVFAGIWSLRTKRRRRKSIIFGALSIILSTFSILQLLEIFLIIPFVAVAGQVLIGILVLSVIIEMIYLGQKFLKEERGENAEIDS